MTSQSLKELGFSIEAVNLGYPRIGKDRELKKATEAFWKGNSSEQELLDAAKALRFAHWQEQKDAGLDSIPSNDFSFYDQMLDMSCLLGAIPSRFNFSGDNVGLDTLFAMARGIQEKDGLEGSTITAMEMTKWFDTNYHYIVPELIENQSFKLSSSKVFDEFKEALSNGIKTRPVLIGPVTYLSLSKAKDSEFNTLSLLDSVLPVYEQILKQLKADGAEWVQMDEPILAMDIDDATKEALTKAYAQLSKSASGLNICLATYFETVEDHLDTIQSLPVQALHVDLVRAPGQVEKVIASIPKEVILSLGVVDGRNIWKTDIAATLETLRAALAKTEARPIQIASSCSMIHSPMDLNSEQKMDDELKFWLSFAKQKLNEIRVLRDALSNGDESVSDELSDNKAALDSRRSSERIHVPTVKKRSKAVKAADMKRGGSVEVRRQKQRDDLKLPIFPTTTIGSFPQTKEVRQKRLQFKKGELTLGAYEHFLQGLVKDAIQRQDDMGLDVYVHGEFERNDMVEYFGEQLEGFVFSQFGWVQSYGSRYVKPPIIFGDVSRPEDMTVEWYKYAQSLTEKPVKGMLTGPVTILQWSFVRNDQPRSETCKQIGLAIRDEVQDLEEAGAKIIQVDEAAFREGLPLRRAHWKSYLEWAVQSFRLCSSGVKDETQIHTHMCYSEFNDIIEAIADMNSDVISIETSRSQMELLDAFVKFEYPSDIGPGVYDIHSPRVPQSEEMKDLMDKALKVLPKENLWVNPDCGLKTRGWDETTLALKAMVETAKTLRAQVAKPVGSSVLT